MSRSTLFAGAFGTCDRQVSSRFGLFALSERE